VVNMSNIRADSWEKKIIKIELSADSLAFIEKHSASIATLNGPPPIPRNAANTPKINPIPTIIKILFIQYVFILCLYLTKKKIKKIEIILEYLAFIEKHIASIATLNGPPPIPRNAANTPKINPIPTIIKILFILYVFILCLYLTNT